MRRFIALLLALLMLPLAAPSAPGPEPVAAHGPDADGGFLLLYDVTRAADGNATLRLLVTRDDAGDLAHGARDLGARHLPAGTTRVELPFLPAEGPGAYAVALAVDGNAGEPLRFLANATGTASASVTWTVPEEPTSLTLLNDTVNADGKLKSPGETLVTRARLADANGVGDVHALRWFVLKDDVVADLGDLALDAPGNATAADLEHRYARSPIAAGEHTLLLRAEKDGAPVAEARRTFVIRDVAPTLAALHVPDVIPDADQNVTADVVLADRNGWSADASVEARVYRGNTRLDGRGFNATLAAPHALPDDAGAARVAYPLRLDVPANATNGTHRVNVYVSGALLGSASFEVLPLPRLLAASAEATGDAVRIALAVSAPAVVDVRLEAGDTVTRSTHALAAGNATLVVPSTAPVADWNVTLRAREGGAALAHAEGRVSNLAPVLSLVPLRAPPRVPALWAVRAPGWDVANASLDATLTRWDGAPVPAVFDFDGDRLSLNATLEPGRYALDVELRFPNGTRAQTRVTLDVAPWLRIELGEPVVAAGEARIPVRSTGAPLRGLVVEVEGSAGPAGLVANGGSVPARPSNGRQVFDVALGTGEQASIVLPLPTGPQPAGARSAHVRVLAIGGSA